MNHDTKTELEMNHGKASQIVQTVLNFALLEQNK